jgi:hypothetical protein
LLPWCPPPLARTNAEAIDYAILLAVGAGVNELVLQHLLEGGAESLPELAPAVEALLDRVFLDEFSR